MNILWKRITDLMVTKTLRLGKGATINVNGTTIDLLELAALNNVVAADIQKIDGITNGTAADDKAVVLGTTKSIDIINFGAIGSSDSSLNVDGLAAATGGTIQIRGGTSSTSATAGGSLLLLGGIAGATGVGGGVNLTGGAGGATSGAGGNINLAGGAGTGNPSNGGVASLIGGLAIGIGSGGIARVIGGAGGTTGLAGAAQVTGGASGNGATGTGGAVVLTGGASLATNGGGGSITLIPGAKAGSGFAGCIVLRSSQGVWFNQPAPAADGADSPITMTIAQMLAGIVSMTPTTGRAVTTPTGAEIEAGLDVTSLAANDGFDFSVQNRAAFAATDDILTLTAGASGVTVTGSAVVSPGSTGRFRCVRTSASNYSIYKIAG